MFYFIYCETMRTGDMVTPKYYQEDLFSEFEYYYDGVLDFLGSKEIGIVLEIRSGPELRVGREIPTCDAQSENLSAVRVLSPRGIAGWVGSKYLDVISHDL